MPITRRRKNICPICQFKTKTPKIYIKKNIKKKLLNKYSFSSRKIPEFMNFDLVQCCRCSLIYVALFLVHPAITTFLFITIYIFFYLNFYFIFYKSFY